jgi:hypothetical protein
MRDKLHMMSLCMNAFRNLIIFSSCMYELRYFMYLDYLAQDHGES